MSKFSFSKKAMIVFAVIIVAWVGAWNIWLFLDSQAIFSSGWSRFIFWTVAKIVIWILPAIWLVKKTNRSVRGLLRVNSRKKCLVWGMGIGSILLLLSVGNHLINDTPMFSNAFSFAFFNAIIIAPIFEEFLMRGAIMGAFRQKHSFVLANSVSALFFVLLHVPGWYYTGNLLTNLSSLTSGALVIFVIGWLCGLATEKGGTVIAGMIVHFLNNLIS